MENEFVIINKTAIQKRIEELTFMIEIGEETNPDLIKACEYRISEIELILSQSKPLIPEIEKAFDEGQSRMQYKIIEKLGLKYQNEQVSQSTILNMEVYSEAYISNLKLDI